MLTQTDLGRLFDLWERLEAALLHCENQVYLLTRRERHAGLSDYERLDLERWLEQRRRVLEDLFAVRQEVTRRKLALDLEEELKVGEAKDGC